MALKKRHFSSAAVQSDVLSHSPMKLVTFSIGQQLRRWCSV